MAARKKIAPDWRGDVKRINADLTRHHNGLAGVYEILKVLLAKVNELESRIALLTPPDANAVDSGKDQQDKPAEAFGSLGEYLEPDSAKAD